MQEMRHLFFLSKVFGPKTMFYSKRREGEGEDSGRKKRIQKNFDEIFVVKALMMRKRLKALDRWRRQQLQAKFVP